MIEISETLRAAITAGKPQRFLLEFPVNGSYADPTTFSNEDIAVSAGVRLSASVNTDEELTIGSCPSAEISFSLLNDVRQISKFTFGECKAWLGARIDSGTPTMKTKTFTEGGETVTYEFAPLGVFIVKRPDIVAKDIIQITANDRMTLFDEELPDGNVPGVTYPTTIGGIASALCSHYGVSLATPTFTNSTLAVSKRPSQFDSRTGREVLRWIAEAAGGFARFNRNGELEIRWFEQTTVSFDEHNYKDFTPTWYKTQAITGLKVRNQEETTETIEGTATNPYVIVGNPFLR